jgi:hypothetical protein
MGPEFSQKNKDILAKRAANTCSNPECGIITAGPSSDPTKALSLGEAAHIHGANPRSARYRADMTDGGRAEIANGIWLCCNCHTTVDGDESFYSAEMLFAWRRQHEEQVSDKFGKKNEVIRRLLDESHFPEIVLRNSFAREIAASRGDFWEFRITAELLRICLENPSRRWRDLKNKFYTVRMNKVHEDDMFDWIQMKLYEARSFIDPIKSLYTVELSKAWGAPGEPGNVEYIAHVCDLIGAMGNELVRWEEDVRFSWVPELYFGLKQQFQGATGHQFEALQAVPAILDQGVDHAELATEGPVVIEHTIVFDLPAGWLEGIENELESIRLVRSKF